MVDSNGGSVFWKNDFLTRILFPHVFKEDIIIFVSESCGGDSVMFYKCSVHGRSSVSNKCWFVIIVYINNNY